MLPSAIPNVPSSWPRKPSQLAPREGGYWNTLGVAHYRAGDWKAAIEALTKSMELGKGGDGSDWFFLAMAHWQLGDKPQARSWYDKAVPWMEKNQPKNEELIRFRAEAAALLGVNEKKTNPGRHRGQRTTARRSGRRPGEPETGTDSLIRFEASGRGGAAAKQCPHRPGARSARLAR